MKRRSTSISNAGFRIIWVKYKYNSFTFVYLNTILVNNSLSLIVFLKQVISFSSIKQFIYFNYLITNWFLTIQIKAYVNVQRDNINGLRSSAFQSVEKGKTSRPAKRATRRMGRREGKGTPAVRPAFFEVYYSCLRPPEAAYFYWLRHNYSYSLVKLRKHVIDFPSRVDLDLCSRMCQEKMFDVLNLYGC